MKKTLLILVLLSLSVKGFGQEKDRMIRTFVIEYDFQTGLFPNKKKLKPRVDVPVVFKIININRLAYTIDIESKDSVIGYSDLSGIEMLLKKSEVEEIAKNVKKAETNPPLQNNIAVNQNDFIAEFYKKNEESLKTMVNDINQTNVKLLEQLNSKISDLAKGTNNVSTEIDIDSKDIPQNLLFHFKTQNDLANLYIGILEKHQTLIALWNDYLQVNTIINNPLLSIDNLKKNNEDFSKIQARFNTNKNILIDFNLLVNRFQNQYMTLKSNSEITQNANFGGNIKLFSIADNMNTEIQAIKQQIEIIQFETLRKNVDQIHSLLILNNKTESLFEYVSDPIQPYQDVAIFKVKIDKNDKNASLFYNERDFSYKELTRHGIRFDLNIGVAGSFYNTDNFYEIKADAKDVRRITKTDKSGFSPSFVGFFTTSYRSATHWTYGLSAGVGISADNGTITLDNFFIGPSLIVGRYERINLTTGVSLKNLRKLNDGFTEGQQVANNTTIEAVTTKSYEPGLFIALTYNLTKGVKNNVKQIKNFL